MGTATASTDVVIRTSEHPALRPLSRLRDLLAAREILGNLVRKEVRVRYKSSVLGAGWSMLNPLLYLGIFSLVFPRILGLRLPNFAIYLLSGLLAWHLFSSSVSSATRSVVENASLVTKVYFPREILPLASIGSTLVDFGLHGLVLGLFLVGSRHGVFGPNLLLLPLALIALLTFTAALSLWVAGLNVRYRDTQHLLSLALLVWFWLTPVVYPSGTVWGRLTGKSVLGIPLTDLYLINPMTSIVEGFHRAIYGVVENTQTGGAALFPVGVGWLAGVIGAVLAGSLVLLWLAWRTFFRLSGDFGEEL